MTLRAHDTAHPLPPQRVHEAWSTLHRLPAGRRPTVLITDDDPMSRKMLHTLLDSQGYNVLTASDGAETLRILDTTPIDLVLLDVMMPHFDGIEVCTRLRRQLGNPELPVVFVTSRADRETRVRAKEAGGDDFFVKPVDGLELLVRVERLLKIREREACEKREAQRLERALKDATEKLLRVERIKTRGALGTGVGHELTNLAMILRMSIARLEGAEAAPAPRGEIDKLSLVAEHLEQHAERLLELGEGRSASTTSVDLAVVARESVALMREACLKVPVEVEAPSEPVLVPMPRAQLEQVIFNLVQNAAEALSQSESPRVKIRVETCDGLHRVHLDVIDNGRGIAEDCLPKVFEPYFTTKTEPHAIGMGLTLTQRIVESAGGRVVLVSREGLGTTATVDFPCCHGAQDEGRKRWQR